jgi:uncharacterized protein YceK
MVSLNRSVLLLLGRAELLSSRSFHGGRKMGSRAICVALLFASLPIAGCGTVANLVTTRPEDGGKSPFGGVRQDVSCIQNPVSEQYRLFCAADLPFSLVGDVLTWPYTAAYSCINQPIPTPPETQAPPDGRPQMPPSEPRNLP